VKEGDGDSRIVSFREQVENMFLAEYPVLATVLNWSWWKGCYSQMEKGVTFQSIFQQIYLIFSVYCIPISALSRIKNNGQD